MPDFTTILPVVKEICDTAVRSLSRFHELTDLDPIGIPESYIASYVFDQLGCRISMAPEITLSMLWRWNQQAHGKSVPDLPDELDNRQQRIDLVLFERTSPIKSEDKLWALVEFKQNWRVQSDIGKLNAILPAIDICKYGVACGVVEPARYPRWLETESKDMKDKGEEFVISESCKLKIDKKNREFIVFAHVFFSSSVQRLP